MTFPKGTAVLKAIAQFSGQTDSYFSSTQHIPPGENSRVPSLIASERQILQWSGWLLPSLLTWNPPECGTLDAREDRAGGHSSQQARLFLHQDISPASWAITPQPQEVSTAPRVNLQGKLYFFGYLTYSWIRQLDRGIRMGATKQERGWGGHHGKR